MILQNLFKLIFKTIKKSLNTSRVQKTKKIIDGLFSNFFINGSVLLGIKSIKYIDVQKKAL